MARTRFDAIFQDQPAGSKTNFELRLPGGVRQELPSFLSISRPAIFGILPELLPENRDAGRPETAVRPSLPSFLNAQK
jgi:hypothetical protein